MRVFAKSIAAAPIAALSALALVGLGAGAAHAAVSTGTVTLTFSDSFTDALRQADVRLTEQGATSVTHGPAHALVVTYTATSGDATLTTFAGTISYTGGITLSHDHSWVALSGLLFDLTDTQFDGQSATSGGEVPLVDLAGTQLGNINAGVQNYAASDLVLDPAGAAYLDSALNTTVFTAGQSIGSFTATWQ